MKTIHLRLEIFLVFFALSYYKRQRSDVNCSRHGSQGVSSNIIQKKHRWKFLGYLAAALRRETPEIASFEAPLTDWWQEFQEALGISPAA